LSKYAKKKAMVLLVCMIACNVTGCGNRTDEYTSPDGKNTIVIEYDYVSRPSIQYEGDCIWEYPGKGFNEEVFFDVEWIDNDSLKLIYADESHDGKYSEEFEIDL